MNKVFLIGRLTKDPIGDNAARYTIAVDGYNDHTDFVSCVCFGKTADFARQYLHKGTKIAIEGHILTGSWEKDGKTIYTQEVAVDRHEFCEGKKAAEPVPEIPEGLGEALPFK